MSAILSRSEIPGVAVERHRNHDHIGGGKDFVDFFPGHDAIDLRHGGGGRAGDADTSISNALALRAMS